MQKIYNTPSKNQWEALAKRPVFNLKELFPTVQSVFDRIKTKGDQALREFTLKFDNVDLERFQVTELEIRKAKEEVSEELKVAIELAYHNIVRFHKAQKEKPKKIITTTGVQCWRESRAIEKVGLYVPGGTAPLFSTVLMLGAPASLAGCRELVLCSPPDANGKIHPAIIYAAQQVGITTIFKLGGIQAVGAMTFGTAAVPKVDKIFGPGNQYVMAAKQLAQNYGKAIDMPAGPSEVLVIADQASKPEFVAADLLSQAEHGPDSQVVLLSNSVQLVEEILKATDRQLQELPRRETAAKALKNSKALVFETIEECLEFSNFYAPEHLILALDKPNNYVADVINAGSVFLGNYSCESAGDYASGTNHTLPTNGYASAYSGVSLDSFVKKITFQELSPKGLQNIGGAIEEMAAAEQLDGHKNAVSIRLNDLAKTKNRD